MESTTDELKQRRHLMDMASEKFQTAYRNDLRPKNSLGEVVAEFDAKSKEDLENLDSVFVVCGRVMFIRSFGKSAFIVIREADSELQIFIDKKTLGDEDYAFLKKVVQVGDIVYAKGTLFRTKTDQLTLNAKEMALVSKALRPLPEKFKGLKDVETRYRQRYVDLIMNEEVREVFVIRSKLITAIRQFLVGKGYLEVETPMLHSIQGGTIARPFKTHHNTLDMPLFLRIAPELYLKRLLVGGFDKVFELNRNFRNEGISVKHNPEFTMLEFYQTYSTFEDLIELTKEMLEAVVIEVTGGAQVEYQGEKIDFSNGWSRISVEEAVLKHSGYTDKTKLRDLESLKKYCADKKYSIKPTFTEGDLIMVIFEEEVEHKLIQPTFVTHYPVAVSPLARKNDEDPYVTDRFELIVYGREIGNAFSELNDPVDQQSRFQAQQDLRDSGDLEACEMDMDYLRALEYAMPPAAGEGIGIDRLAMLLTDAPSIRDVIFFPLLRHEESSASNASDNVDLVQLPTIKNERIILRPYNEAKDLQDIFEVCSDKKMTQFLPWEAHQSETDTKAYFDWVQQKINLNRDEIFWIFAVEDIKTGKVIGGVDVKKNNKFTVQVDAMIGSKYWSQGYLTDASLLVIKLVKKYLPEVVRIEAYCEPENVGSQKVMEKAGLEYEGLHKKAYINRGKPVDIIRYAIIL